MNNFYWLITINKFMVTSNMFIYDITLKVKKKWNINLFKCFLTTNLNLQLKRFIYTTAVLVVFNSFSIQFVSYKFFLVALKIRCQFLMIFLYYFCVILNDFYSFIVVANKPSKIYINTSSKYNLSYITNKTYKESTEILKRLKTA